MASTIRNPVEWSADQIKAASEHLGSVGESLGGADDAAEDRLPEIRRVKIEDLREVLQKGVDDFATVRTDVVFLVVVYPAVGLLLTYLAFDQNVLPLLFPAIAGFALLGPVAAVGLYELSRRREQGKETNWARAFWVVASPSFGAILALGLILAAIFVIWMMAAQGIYNMTMGPEPPASVGAFVSDIFTTGAGWAMIVIGLGVGFLFACLVLAISVVSFPLLLDRDVGLPVAVITSIRVTQKNTRAIGAWGAIVAASLALGSIPLFLGLMIVMPILGHATWHLYRKAVVPPAPAGTREAGEEAETGRS